MTTVPALPLQHCADSQPEPRHLCSGIATGTMTRAIVAAVWSFSASGAIPLQRGTHDYRDPRYLCSVLPIPTQKRDATPLQCAMGSVTRATAVAVWSFSASGAIPLQRGAHDYYDPRYL